MKTQRTKRTKRTYDYMLPGDEQEVQTHAYSYGLNALARSLFASLPPGAPAPDAFLTTFPDDQATIDDMARDLAGHMLTQHTVNNPALFRPLFVEQFAAGYRFGLFACLNGYIQLSHSLLDTDRRYELAFRFARELLTKETAPDCDVVMGDALERLRAIYKQYRALN